MTMTHPEVVAVDRTADRALLRLVYVVAGVSAVLAFALAGFAWAYFSQSGDLDELRSTNVDQAAALESQGALLTAFAGLVAAQGDPEATAEALAEIRELAEQARQRRQAAEEGAADRIDTPRSSSATASPTATPAGSTPARPAPSTTRPSPPPTTSPPPVVIDPPPIDLPPIVLPPIRLLLAAMSVAPSSYATA